MFIAMNKTAKNASVVRWLPPSEIFFHARKQANTLKKVPKTSQLSKKFSEPSENPKTIYLRHFYEVLAKFKDSSRFKPVYASLRWFMPFHRVPVTFDTSLLSQNEFFIA